MEVGRRLGEWGREETRGVGAGRRLGEWGRGDLGGGYGSVCCGVWWICVGWDGDTWLHAGMDMGVCAYGRRVRGLGTRLVCSWNLTPTPHPPPYHSNTVTMAPTGDFKFCSATYRIFKIDVAKESSCEQMEQVSYKGKVMCSLINQCHFLIPEGLICSATSLFQRDSYVVW